MKHDFDPELDPLPQPPATLTAEELADLRQLLAWWREQKLDIQSRVRGV